MKYGILLALLVCAVYAQEEEIEDVLPQIEEAAMLMPNMYMSPMSRMRYSAMANQMMAQPPPQQAIDHYSQMTDDDFPVDYSLACSNSCGCRTYCTVMWFVPCNCMCAPRCPEPTAAPQNPNNRFPVTEFPPQQPPRLPPRFTTTTQAPWRPLPEPINPPSWNNRWPQQPNWNDPHNPNNFPTHAPQPRNPSTTAAPIWNQRPPIWNNPGGNNWDPNNPKNHLTFPPATTTQSPSVWWPQQPQQPNNPWWPQQPQPPQTLPEIEVPWWQQPRPQPLPEQNLPWWQQNNNNQQPPVILPEIIPPQWQRPAPEPQVPDFPTWNQSPITDWAPPRQEDIGLCDDTCSCTPCTIIWICPVQCSSACCASRRFSEIATAEKADSQKDAQRAL